MSTLSGGNQQKAMLARWMMDDCKVLLLNEPFQGVDISSRRQIGTLLRNTAENRATIAVCTDVEEALEIADRIIVFNHNNLVGEHRIDQIDMPTLIAQIAAAPKVKKTTERLPRRYPMKDTREFAIKYGLLILLALMLIGFSLAEPAFLSTINMMIILQSVSIVAILALGVTATLAVDGFDLSIGSTAAFSMMTSSYVMVVMDGGPVMAIIAAIGVGVLVGLVNGFMTVQMKVPDLLTTLGMMFLLLGLQLIPTQGRSISAGMSLSDGSTASGTFSESFLFLGRARLFDIIPVPVVIMLILAVVTYVFLERTRHGRYVCHWFE